MRSLVRWRCVVVRSSPNFAERVNREIKRRTQVVYTFSSETSCERLITSLLVETADGWLGTDRIYLKLKNELTVVDPKNETMIKYRP